MHDAELLVPVQQRLLFFRHLCSPELLLIFLYCWFIADPSAICAYALSRFVSVRIEAHLAEHHPPGLAFAAVRSGKFYFWQFLSETEEIVLSFKMPTVQYRFPIFRLFFCEFHATPFLAALTYMKAAIADIPVLTRITDTLHGADPEGTADISR